jgi:hypothetical protein
MGSECVFKAAKKMFHQTVGLLSMSLMDVQQVAQGGPQGGGELGAYPLLKQSICTDYCCGGGNWPARSSVCDSKQGGVKIGQHRHRPVEFCERALDAGTTSQNTKYIYI